MNNVLSDAWLIIIKRFKLDKFTVEAKCLHTPRLKILNLSLCYNSTHFMSLEISFGKSFRASSVHIEVH